MYSTRFLTGRGRGLSRTEMLICSVTSLLEARRAFCCYPPLRFLTAFAVVLLLSCPSTHCPLSHSLWRSRPPGAGFWFTRSSSSTFGLYHGILKIKVYIEGLSLMRLLGQFTSRVTLKQAPFPATFLWLGLPVNMWLRTSWVSEWGEDWKMLYAGGLRMSALQLGGRRWPHLLSWLGSDHTASD